MGRTIVRKIRAQHASYFGSQKGIAKCQRRSTKRLWLAFVGFFAFSLNACATPTFFGIPLADGQATDDLRQLAVQARNGNREAAFQLAERFEVGNGVPVDLEKAVSLYHRAARPVGGASNPVFSSDGELVQGATNSGFYVSGLPEANSRAAKLERILDLTRIGPSQRFIDVDLIKLISLMTACEGEVARNSRDKRERSRLLYDCALNSSPRPSEGPVETNVILLEAISAALRPQMEGQNNGSSEFGDAKRRAFVGAYKSTDGLAQTKDIFSFIYFSSDIFAPREFGSNLSRLNNDWFALCGNYGNRIARQASAGGSRAITTLAAVCHAGRRDVKRARNFEITRNDLWGSN